MVSITFPVEDHVAKLISDFPWVSWSKIAHEELRKKVIFEKYMKHKTISSDDSKFCELIDWNPVDELPLKKGYLKKLRNIRKEKVLPLKSADNLFT